MPDLRTKFLTLPAPPSRQTRRRDRRRRAMAGAGPQRRRAHRRRRLAVARPAALLRDQTCGAVTPKRLQQPPHLALAAPQELRRSTHRQPTTIDVPQHLETPQLAIAHAQHRHQSRLPQPATKPGRLTFLNWTALTFARWVYTLPARDHNYVICRPPSGPANFPDDPARPTALNLLAYCDRRAQLRSGEGAAATWE